MKPPQRVKWLFDVERGRTAAKHINGYLMDGPDVFVESRRKPICTAGGELVFGSMPNDGGYLSDWDDERKNVVVAKYPSAAPLFREFIGATEFINRRNRWCLWLEGVSPSLIRSVPQVLEAVEAVCSMRASSSRASTKKLAETPTLFGEIRQPDTSYLLIPRHSSENRHYIPLGYIDPKVICGDSCMLVPKATLYHFGVLTSSVHMAWMRTVCGRLKSDYRYSAAIVYNNFPWPEGVGAECQTPRANSNAEIEKAAQGILDARAKYPDSSLADLYDPLTMPSELRKAHATNDAAVMKAYGFPPDLTEPEIVSRLFEMYAKLTKGV